jgi:hypothetical protein
MDGPRISWTVADLLNGRTNPKTALTYHVMSSGFAAFTPIGIVAGALVRGAGFRKYPALVTMGSTACLMGCFGAFFGYMGMRQASMSANENDKVPNWDEEGLQMRMDGINHNFKCRLLDLGCWVGIASSAGTLLYTGGPSKIGLSRGPLGIAQGISLGAGAAGFFTMAYLAKMMADEKALANELALEERVDGGDTANKDV